MSTEWIHQELETVDLNDKRLDRRLGEVLLALSQQPNVSIPAACGGYAETMAAYRFFSNEKTTLENILAPHRDATLKRIAEQVHFSSAVSSCEILFDESEWKSVYRIKYPKRALPKEPPDLGFMLRLVGELGGWVATPGKKEMPGTKTIWIGLQRMHDFAKAWKTFGPDPKHG
jgi:hypothetical protein